MMVTAATCTLVLFCLFWPATAAPATAPAPVCPSWADSIHPAYLPHPSRCNLFYQCAGGRPVLHSCPFPLYFDPILNVCNWPEQVNCHHEETTTEFPSNLTTTFFPSNSTITVYPSNSTTTIFPSNSTTTIFPSNSTTVIPSNSTTTTLLPTTYSTDAEPTDPSEDYTNPTEEPNDPTEEVF